MELRRRALGRGLGAIIPTGGEEPDLGEAGNETQVELSRIRPNPKQPRTHFAEEALEELVSSIREKGLLQPLLVRPIEDGRFELIAGERRFRASLRAGLERVPVLVRTTDDGESLELALIENIQRQNLNPLEEARAFQRLSEEFGLRQSEIAARVSKSRSAIANTVRLLTLPSVIQEMIAAEQLTAGHARTLLSLESEAAQIRAATAIVESGLSVRESETLSKSSGATKRRDAVADPDLRRAESELSRHLATRVRIRKRPKGNGRIEIEFYSLAELNGLLERLNPS